MTKSCGSSKMKNGARRTFQRGLNCRSLSRSGVMSIKKMSTRQVKMWFPTLINSQSQTVLNSVLSIFAKAIYIHGILPNCPQLLIKRRNLIRFFGGSVIVFYYGICIVEVGLFGFLKRRQWHAIFCAKIHHFEEKSLFPNKSGRKNFLIQHHIKWDGSGRSPGAFPA